MKGKTYIRYSTHQGYSDSTEKLKPLKQANANRFQHHQTRFLANAKGTSLGRKHKRRKRPSETNPPKMKKMVIGTYISIITLNVNGLNAQTKRHRLAKWIQKQDLYIRCLQQAHFRPRDT